MASLGQLLENNRGHVLEKRLLGGRRDIKAEDAMFTNVYVGNPLLRKQGKQTIGATQEGIESTMFEATHLGQVREGLRSSIEVWEAERLSCGRSRGNEVDSQPIGFVRCTVIEPLHNEFCEVSKEYQYIN